MGYGAGGRVIAVLRWLFILGTDLGVYSDAWILVVKKKRNSYQRLRGESRTLV